MDQAIAFAASACFLSIGFSCLVHTDDWIAWLSEVQMGGRRRALGFGSLGLGLVLNALIVGIGGILEGTLYLLFPGALPRILLYYAPRHMTVGNDCRAICR